MKLTVLEESNKRVVLEIEGAGHSFCNALKSELYADEDVNVATYAIDHPLIGKPKFIVETNGKESPKKALVNAAKRLKKTNEKFELDFLKLK
ncbi:DNA-directed RNA polymerase subunit L [Candidatus Woesearchaeota archaeon]|nr:DNA-directed RNA polymerase subunit L [Candidatus Woesearchaeota archaeon]